jgi:MOSC domain-containing protein YiiM
MVEAEILSIQVGMPKTYDSDLASHDGEDRSWESGIFKSGIMGPVWLSENNLVGDGQADLRVHGGRDRAILIYSAVHYPEWEARANCDLEFGSFGENITVSNLTELDVCLGDVWASGDIEIEVSQPRLPCFKLARRNNWPGLNLEVIKNRKGGWYARVLRQGGTASTSSAHSPSTSNVVDRPRFPRFYVRKKRSPSLARAARPAPAQHPLEGVVNQTSRG